MPAPKILKCPLTGQVMMDPVVLSGDNYTYERAAITDYLKNNTTSPKTGNPLVTTQLIENNAMREQVEEYLIEHPEAFEEEEVYFQAEAMLDAIKSNEIKKVLDFYQRDKRFFVKAIDEVGYTAFHHLCQTGSLLMLKQLLAEVSESQLAQLVNLTAPLNWQPTFLNELLLEASKEGKTAIVEQCLELGANINTPSKAEHNDTPLHLAVKYGHMATVELLIKRKANLEPQAIDGSTPLNFAGFYGRAEAAKLLITAGAKLQHADDAGNTPFHDAMARGHQAAAGVLLQAGADRHSKNREGKTPLEVGNKVMQDWLIQERKRLKTAKEKNLLEIIEQQGKLLEQLSIRITDLADNIPKQVSQIDELKQTRQVQGEQIQTLTTQLTELMQQKAAQDQRLNELQQSLQLQKLASEHSTEKADVHSEPMTGDTSPRFYK